MADKSEGNRPNQKSTEFEDLPLTKGKDQVKGGADPKPAGKKPVCLTNAMNTGHGSDTTPTACDTVASCT